MLRGLAAHISHNPTPGACRDIKEMSRSYGIPLHEGGGNPILVMTDHQ